VNGSVRTWIPATLVAVVVAALLGVGAYFALNRANSTPKSSVSPSPDIHSKAAVMAAIEHYYDVEAEARKTGNGDLIDSVTTGPNSLASQNFKTFIAQESATNRRSVITENHFEAWNVDMTATTAIVSYSYWLRGHDIDPKTATPLEADTTLPKRTYHMTVVLKDGRWLVQERQLVGSPSA
jgi:hypothetical protein